MAESRHLGLQPAAFQLFVQICLPFMALFGLLCTIGIYLGGYLLHVLYRKKNKIPFGNKNEILLLLPGKW